MSEVKTLADESAEYKREVEKLIERAREMRMDSEIGNPAERQGMLGELANALSFAVAERDVLAGILEQVRALRDDLLPHLNRLDGGSSVEVVRVVQRLNEALDSAPSVARARPATAFDREAVRRVIAGRATILNDHQVDELVDAVLAAFGSAPVVSDDTEWEYRRVDRNGRPILYAVFDQMPLLDEGYSAERRSIGPWVAIEKGGE